MRLKCRFLEEECLSLVAALNIGLYTLGELSVGQRNLLHSSRAWIAMPSTAVPKSLCGTEYNNHSQPNIVRPIRDKNFSGKRKGLE